MQCSTFQEMSKKKPTCLSFFWLIFFVPKSIGIIKALSDEQGLTSSIYSNPGKESSLEISRDFKLSERENTVLCLMYVLLSLKYNIRNSLFQ